MNNIAKALVITIQYLGSERNDEEYTEDDDLKIVEEAASIIQEASEDEKAILIEASKELGLNDWGNQIGIE
ncbi:MAG TPA: hypothetical protein ENJ84_10305 [Gammaproteobacteria bacterium]|nr:hypothetical protein [Gammaproteobacteria bacterium]